MKIQAGKNAGFHHTHTATLAAYRQKLHRHCSSCVALGAQADLRYSKGAIRVKQEEEGNRGRDTHASESSLPNHTAGNVRADGICTERGGGRCEGSCILRTRQRTILRRLVSHGRYERLPQ